MSGIVLDFGDGTIPPTFRLPTEPKKTETEAEHAYGEALRNLGPEDIARIEDLSIPDSEFTGQKAYARACFREVKIERSSTTPVCLVGVIPEPVHLDLR